MEYGPFLVVLDDEPEIAALIGTIAERGGFDVEVTSSLAAFESACRARRPDVLAIDLQMPKTDGIEVLRALARERERAGILLISGVDERTLNSAEQFGTSNGLNLLGTLQKPFSPDELSELLALAQLSTRALTPKDLQRALQNDELEVMYQPTVQLCGDGTWRAAAMEALLRWNHPVRGLLTPDTFVQMGEDHGLGGAMTDWVVQHGIEQLKGWRAAQLELGLRINIAATLITDIEFPDRLAATLMEHGIPPADLTLEVTEIAMLDHRPDTADILTRLRVKGINLAIDDFGIGNSSLTQLFSLPFNEMKIDKSLMLRVPTSEEARIMVEALVGLAHKLGLSACTEGVEYEEGLTFLNRIRCDAAQGYYISRAIPADRVPGFVLAWDERQTRWPDRNAV